MVTVPRDIENRVTPNPLPSQRLQAADYGAAGQEIARGVASLGQSVQQFTHDQDQIKYLYDTAAVKKADADATAALTQVRTDYTSKIGFDAVGAKDAAQKQIADIRRQYADSLANPRQKAMFGDAFDVRAPAEYSVIASHEAKQVQLASIDASKARSAAKLDSAVSLYLSGDRTGSQAALSDALLEVPSSLPGAGSDVINNQKRSLASGYHLSIADGLRDSDPLSAQAYIDAHAGEMSADDVIKFNHANHPAVEEAKDDTRWGQVLAVSSGAEPADGEKSAVAADRPHAAQEGWLPGPDNARITSGFTDMRDGGKREHQAVDIAAPLGYPIRVPMEGTVEKVWRTPEGGNQVRVKLADGRVAGFADLRDVAVKTGDKVTPDTVIGGAGSSGSTSTGSHIHFNLEDASGRRIDPRTARYDNTPLLTRHTADRVDLQSTFDAIHSLAVRENWTPQETERMYARAQREAGYNDMLKQRVEEDAKNQVLTQLDKLGDNFTSIGQLKLPSNLPPGYVSTLKSAANANAKALAGNDTADNSETFLDLYEAAGNPATQQQFATMDLTPLRSKMSRGNFNALRKQQIDITNGKNNAVGDQIARADAAVKQFLPQGAGVSYSPGMTTKDKQAAQQRRVNLMVHVRAAVQQAEEEKGRPLTPDEMSQIVKSNIAPVYVNNDINLPVSRGALASGETYATSVPKADRAAIITAWRQTHGNAPLTEGMIARIYLRHGGGIQ